MRTLPLPDDARIQYLLRPETGAICVQPLVPYDERACALLHQLSLLLLADPEARRYPDVMSFGYWCRKANIGRLKLEHGESRSRLGLGLAFHVAPANVPANFAFSYAFALLSGNASIVRVPSKDFAQVGIICRVLGQLFRRPEFALIGAMTAMVRFAQDDAITGQFSAMCNARLIWGGDQAIGAIRRLPIPARSVEITFADRYSFCAIDASSLLRAAQEQVAALATGFYNDIFLMDQNACSSPHLVVWLGEAEAIAAAKDRFWPAVHAEAATRLELQAVQAVDKYTLLCRNAIDLGNVAGAVRHDNHIYRLTLDSVAPDMHALRGKYGLVYEFDTLALDDVAHIVNTTYQTLTYFGLEREQCLDFVIDKRLAGIDRIVPIGKALDIGIIWDGYDIVRSLSRIVDFR
jgi:hypothetical protein